MTTEKTSSQTQQSSMESGEQGTPSSQIYEYWQGKSSGDIYAVKNESGGVKSFHGPLNKDQLSIDPSGFSYTKNPNVQNTPTEFERLTRQQLDQKIQSGQIKSKV